MIKMETWSGLQKGLNGDKRCSLPHTIYWLFKPDLLQGKEGQFILKFFVGNAGLLFMQCNYARESRQHS